MLNVSMLHTSSLVITCTCEIQVACTVCDMVQITGQQRCMHMPCVLLGILGWPQSLLQALCAYSTPLLFVKASLSWPHDYVRLLSAAN